MRVAPAAIQPDLCLVGSPADSVQQSSIALRVIRNTCGDDLTGSDIGDLHSPEVSHIVNDVIACAVYCIRSEDPRIRPNSRDRKAGRINQIQVSAASVAGLGLLENRSG